VTEVASEARPDKLRRWFDEYLDESEHENGSMWWGNWSDDQIIRDFALWVGSGGGQEISETAV
jgi:hypothetical protein